MRTICDSCHKEGMCGGMSIIDYCAYWELKQKPNTIFGIGGQIGFGSSIYPISEWELKQKKEEKKVIDTKHSWTKEQMIEALRQSITAWKAKKENIVVTGDWLGLLGEHEIDIGNCAVCKLISGREDGEIQEGDCGDHGCVLDIEGGCGNTGDVTEAMEDGNLPRTLKQMDMMIDKMIAEEDKLVKQNGEEKERFPKLMVNPSSGTVILATGRSNNACGKFDGTVIRQGHDATSKVGITGPEKWSAHFKDYEGALVMSNKVLDSVDTEVWDNDNEQVDYRIIELNK